LMEVITSRACMVPPDTNCTAAQLLSITLNMINHAILII
jgi:hypothetical protein